MIHVQLKLKNYGVVKWFVLLLFVFLVSGCSGSSASLSPAASTVYGVAATGSAISGRIFLKDAASHEIFVDTQNGTFSFNTATLLPPFILKAEWTKNGVTQDLYSFVNSAGRANITPLTHTLVLMAAGVSDPGAIYGSLNSTSFAAIAANLRGSITQLRANLKPLLDQYSADMDPISGEFSANHTGMDKLLDSVSFSFTAGNVTITDKTTNAQLFTAPITNLNKALSALAWTDADAAIANDPSVAVNPGGHGLVVWSGSDGTAYKIWAKWLDGVSAPVMISNAAGDAIFPRIGFDAGGNAIAIWEQNDAGRWHIWANRYVVNVGWGTPRQVSANNAGDASYPGIGVDGNGNAIVVWYEGITVVTNHFDVYSSRYIALSNTWSAPILLSNGQDSAYRCRVAVNANGKGVVAWAQDQNTDSNAPEDIWGRNYNTDGTSGATTKLNSISGPSSGVYAELAVAMDGAGNGMVVWVQTNGISPFNIWSERYTATNGWGTAAIISSGVTGDCYAPDIGIDGSGNAFAVWQQQDGIDGAFTAANIYSIGSGWGVSGKISDTGVVQNNDIHVAVDTAGNASVVWYQQDQNSFSIRANRYLVGAGWGPVQLVSVTSADGGSSYAVPQIATNPGGQSFVVWGLDRM